jgi:hypothetical protein
VIRRICAVSLVVLIAVPFIARFATDFTTRDSVTVIIDAVAAATSDDVPVWSDRSGRHHHAMQLAAFNSGDASFAPAFSCTPLPPAAVTSVPHDTFVVAAVLRV